jgi:excisionase family DNA binding protein
MRQQPVAPLQGKVAYSVAEVAGMLGVSTDKVYELVRGGCIPHRHVGRRILVPCRSFDRWLNDDSQEDGHG